MNRIFTTATFLVALAGNCFAGERDADGEMGFSSSAVCVAAAKQSLAKEYVPSVNKALPRGYVVKTMSEAGFLLGACVRGDTIFRSGVWVYMGPSFRVAVNGQSFLMAQCANKIDEIVTVPAQQPVARAEVAPATSPPVLTPATVPSVASALAPVVNVTVNVGACPQGSECKPGLVAIHQKEVVSTNGSCGIIETGTGRVFQLGHHKLTGFVAMVEIGKSGSYVSQILSFNGAKNNDCQIVQQWIEGRRWGDVVKHFALPDTCTPATAQRQAGTMKPL
jgi:hypothetical protein